MYALVRKIRRKIVGNGQVYLRFSYACIRMDWMCFDDPGSLHRGPVQANGFGSGFQGARSKRTRLPGERASSIARATGTASRFLICRRNERNQQIFQTGIGLPPLVIFIICNRPFSPLPHSDKHLAIQQGFLDYTDKELPAESPPQFGLHPNAEIGYLTNSCESLFKAILNIAGKGRGQLRAPG